MAGASSVVGERIVTPKLPSEGLYTSKEARSCVVNCYFDFANLCNLKISIKNGQTWAIAIGGTIEQLSYIKKIKIKT